MSWLQTEQAWIEQWSALSVSPSMESACREISKNEPRVSTAKYLRSNEYHLGAHEDQMVRSMINFLRYLKSLFHSHSQNDRDQATTLIIQPLPGIGDMIWHLPHIHAIARTTSQSKVDILTKPRSLADRLLAGDSLIGRIFWLERNPGQHDGLSGFFRLIGLLRRGRFQQVWILHGSARYTWAAWIAGITERIGYGVGIQKYLLTVSQHLPPAYRREHPITKADLLLDLMAIPRDETEPKLPVHPEAERRMLQNLGTCARPWIALGIASSEPFKQWGAERFAKLVLALQGTAGTLYLVGGPAERDLADAIMARVPQGEIRDAIALPIDQTAALLSQCRLYIGNDTGVLNMAAALEVPAVGLFGGSQPLRHSRFIYPVLPSKGKEGMHSITVQQVLHAMKQWDLLKWTAEPMQ